MQTYNNNDYTRKIKKFAFILCSFLPIIFFIGCNKRNVEAPNNKNNILGFGDNDKKSDYNSFNDKKTPVAKQDAYTYYTSEEFQAYVVERLNGKITSIYDEAYQNFALKELELIKEQRTYSPENPLFILNPFGTNNSGLYVYLGDNNQNVKMSYTISVEDETIADFNEDLYIDLNGKETEGLIVGFLQGHRNKLILDVKNMNNKSISKKAYYFEIPDLDTIKEERIASESSNYEELTRGLYTVLAMDDTLPHFLFYDNNGIVRSEIPLEIKSAPSKLVQIGNQVFYAARDDLFVFVDNIGHISKYYAWNKNDIYYDYDCDEENYKILFLAGDGNVEGRILEILNLETGEWEKTISFSNLLREATQFNSIEVVRGNDIIVSSDELSSIVRINNIYSYPVIRWIMAEEPIWNGSKYESLLLAKVGDFTTHAGQGRIFYKEDKKLKEGQFYLSILNFNYGKNNLPPNMNWSLIEGIGTDENPATNSYYYKYLVDENNNRYELIQSIPIPYNTSSCMALPYGNHVIISIGSEKEFREYNAEGEIMSRYKFKDTNSSYQVFKLTMDRYWF